MAKTTMCRTEVLFIRSIAVLLLAASCESYGPPVIPDDAVLVTHEVGPRGVSAQSDGGYAIPRPEVRIDLGDACAFARMSWSRESSVLVAEAPAAVTVVDDLVFAVQGDLTPGWLEVVPYGCREWFTRLRDGVVVDPPLEVDRASGYLRVGNTSTLRWTVHADLAFELPDAPGHWRRAIVSEREVPAL